MTYCPSSIHPSPIFAITAENGDLRTFVPNVRYLPEAMVHSIALSLLVAPILIALFYLATMRLTAPMRFNASPVLLFVALVLLCMLIQTVSAFTISDVFDFLRDVFGSRSWQMLGSVLAGMVYIPLGIQLFRRGAKRRMRADLVAICTFLVFVILLYSPADFASIGQWEAWPYQAHFDGRPSKVVTELVSRFWILVPYALANAISPESFAGHHVVIILMMFGMLVLLYGILRQLKTPAWIAFLATMLFLVYPVNPAFMSIRSIAHNFNKLTLMAAVFFVLDSRKDSSRLHLLGIWLALLFNIGSHETAYAILLVIPLLWWWEMPSRIWRNVNLTVIWYLFPATKVVYLLLLTMNQRAYYGASATDQFALDSAGHYLDVIAGVYRQTFLYGPREAMAAIGQHSSAILIVTELVLIGVVAVYLSRESSAEVFPSRKRIAIALLGGLIFILPSIGVLMWLGDYYARDIWRMSIFVPIGAAIAVTGLVILVATLIKNARLRQALVIGLCLVLMFPALSRLFVQQRRFENSADAKARVLMQLVEQAPYFDSDARLMLLTAMSFGELNEHGIDELQYNMLDSAIFVLYQEGRPKVAFLCVLGRRCSTNDISIRENYLQRGTDFSDIVMFRLNDDLSVELLRELPPELGGSENDTYHPERLIDTSAPIPPRALTMLASARRAFANP